ncbi:MAG: hypothetical protein ACJ8LM_04880, partial [Candidatus Udaeobacter sp.]
IGFYQFKSSRQAEVEKELRQRNSELDKEVRQTKQAKLEALLKHPKDTVPSASSVLVTLNYLSENTPSQSDVRDISDALRLLFIYDYIEENDKLTEARLTFEALVNDNWPDYRALMSERTSDNKRLIHRYLRMIEHAPDASTRDALKDALFRHGMRLFESHLDKDEVKERDELFARINEHLNNWMITKDGRVRK